MANNLNKFNAGSLDAGINTNTCDFTIDFELSPESKNLTTGINQGQGPRYGMSPIPGQSNLDMPLTATALRGLRAAETAGYETKNFVNRLKFLGIIPLVNGTYDAINDKINVFMWFLSDNLNTDPNIQSLSAVLNSIYDTPNTLYKYSGDMGDGFQNNTWLQMEQDALPALTGWLSPLMNHVAAPNETTLASNIWMRDFLRINSDLFWCSSSSLTVTGALWEQKWLIGNKITIGTATTTATANFVGTNFNMGGIPPSYNLRNFQKNNRDLTFYNMDATALGNKYVYSSYPVTDATFIASFNQNNSNSNYLVSGNASVIETGTIAPSLADITDILLNDELNVCDGSYRASFVAAKKPFMFLIQDWERDIHGRNVQVMDLTDKRFKPPCYSTLNFGIGGTPGDPYLEDGCQKSTSFFAWPNFESDHAMLTIANLNSGDWDDIQQFVGLGAAGTGILRANRVYEFNYSIFDKQYGIETNVGLPVKFRTGNDDNVSLGIYRDQKTGLSPSDPFEQLVPRGTILSGKLPILLPDMWNVTSTLNYGPTRFNYIQFRFYYREQGSYDWLPALFIDAPQFFYYPNFQVLYACQGNVAATPGGQPGAFNDYSYLPNDEYTCVVTYKNRVFWFSQNNATFSLRNNPFAYPLRNSTTSPVGGFSGAIVHTYRGQSEQESRLVIFGKKETYIGKFTGLPTTMPIVISPTTIANYEVDGSDFNVETWTSITSFSFRSAIVADGDLYWWGPQGIFIDNGVGNPLRISKNIEPLLFTLYDESLIEDIHCIYDDKTKEIIWFYPPRGANTKTNAIRLNIETEQFFFDAYDCKIDWAQRIATNNPGVTQQTNGLRTILSVRADSSADTQRAVFYDQLNRSGDYAPTKELLVKAVANGSNSFEKVLTLDTGVNLTSLASVTLGDYIAFQQSTAYSSQIISDMIAKVVSVNTVGTPTITVNIPRGALLPSFTLTDQKLFFPVWQAKKKSVGLNGIPWTLQTKYWAPVGPNYSLYWQWLYMLVKYEKWLKIDPTTMNCAYRSPSTVGDFISDILEFSDNSDANWQIFHAFRPGDAENRGNNQGQGLKLRLSGIHIGEEWVIQYLEIQSSEERGNILKMYQG